MRQNEGHICEPSTGAAKSMGERSQLQGSVGSLFWEITVKCDLRCPSLGVCGLCCFLLVLGLRGAGHRAGCVLAPTRRGSF